MSSRLESRLSPSDNNTFAASNSCTPLVLSTFVWFSTKSGRASSVGMPVNVRSFDTAVSFADCTPGNAAVEFPSVDVLGVGSVKVVDMPDSVFLAFGDPICRCAQSLLDEGSLLGRSIARFRLFGLTGVSSSSPSFRAK